MSKKMFMYISLGICIITLLGLAYHTSHSSTVVAAVPVPDTPQNREIMEVMERAYELINSASQSFDTSLFSSVFIDTPDYKLTDEQRDAISSVLGEEAAQNGGYLTAMKAQYIARKKEAGLLKDVLDKARAENREMTAEELQEVVIKNNGRVPAIIASNETKAKLIYESIEISGERAVVRYDDGAALQEAILVRVDGQWFIAGITPINIHF